jgi:predicted nucleic acid-binding protein
LSPSPAACEGNAAKASGAGEEKIRTLLDTSCIVAAVCAWHERHDAARTAVELCLRTGNDLVLAAPALVEAYAVLTRLPPPHRLSGRDALALLDANWGETETVSLTAAEYWRLLRECPGAGTTGGQTYDAVIAACARKARAQRLLTLNLEHFARFREDLIISAPGDR